LYKFITISVNMSTGMEEFSKGIEAKDLKESL
jgi:hypothetical protein